MFGSFFCSCEGGYYLLADGFTCNGKHTNYKVTPEPVQAEFLCHFSDTNECIHEDDNDCDINGFCTNTDGSYFCTCSVGYVGNGTDGDCTGIMYIPHKLRCC